MMQLIIIDNHALKIMDKGVLPLAGFKPDALICHIVRNVGELNI